MKEKTNGLVHLKTVVGDQSKEKRKNGLVQIKTEGGGST